jgi:hypothetical protein
MENERRAELVKPIILEKTGEADRPEWTSKTTFFENGQVLHFCGGWMGGGDYAASLRLARSEATKNLLESIRIRANSEFAAALSGSNRQSGDVGRYITDTVAWTVDSLRVEGISQREIYYEQYLDPPSLQVKYNAWVQLVISKSDYTKAKLDAAHKLYEKSIQEKDQEAKEKALQLLDKLRQG